MNRFVPDTLRDALWRPVAMAAPDAGTYIEFMAPDLRFAMLLLLMAATAIFALMRRRPAAGRSPAWLLIAFTWIAFVPWLATTGNGRYFIAVLLLTGPMCVALIHRMPMTAGFRLAAAAILIGVQGFAVFINNPWGRWPLAPWSEPYFDLPLTDQERSRPAAYITVTGISYSLIAPLFHPGSRWMNVASLPIDPEQSMDARRAQAFLQAVTHDKLPLKVIAPSVPIYMQDDGQPSEPMRNEINRLLSGHGVALAGGEACAFVPSRTMAALTLGDLDDTKRAKIGKFGFWICNLQYPVARKAPPLPTPEDARSALVFDKLERTCPRIFPPGSGTVVHMAGGTSRSYASADIKAYVLDNGDVLYKYWRGLNPGRIASVEQVLAEGFQMECNSIRGRSGLPWERKL